MKEIKKSVLNIDSTSGGFGDVWMRLIGFYAMAALAPVSIQILIPNQLRQLAEFTFGDRLKILTEKNDTVGVLTYTSLGIRDLAKGIFKGKRYIAPYHRSVIHDKKNKGVKDIINIAIFNIAHQFGLIQVPAWEWITYYQGYLDIIGIKQLEKIEYEPFYEQVLADYKGLYYKLSEIKQSSKQLVIPTDLHTKTIIFPTGTGRQFVSADWAKKYFPKGYFAFFHLDSDIYVFQENGLLTIPYYDPVDIIILASSAKWAVTTDSFPSHLLQYSSERCTITITGTLKSRIVSPAFTGVVVDAEVPCHPCLHLERTNRPLCVAGYRECLNWSNKVYVQNILNSIPS